MKPKDPAFSETTAYAPNSPYAASKAGSDHLVRAYFHTYGLPTVTTNCSNNYRPFQYPEKLIPLIILNAIEGKPLPVYGDGQNVRDCLFVGDHCSAIWTVLAQGRSSETYKPHSSFQLRPSRPRWSLQSPRSPVLRHLRRGSPELCADDYSRFHMTADLHREPSAIGRLETAKVPRDLALKIITTPLLSVETAAPHRVVQMHGLNGDLRLLIGHCSRRG